MTPTVFLAYLASSRVAGSAIGGDLHSAAPLHLSLHTSDQAAVDALNAAMRAEWDRCFAYGLGPASTWDRAALSRRMVEDGYLAAVVERPVALDAPDPVEPTPEEDRDEPAVIDLDEEDPSAAWTPCWSCGGVGGVCRICSGSGELRPAGRR